VLLLWIVLFAALAASPARAFAVAFLWVPEERRCAPVLPHSSVSRLERCWAQRSGVLPEAMKGRPLRAHDIGLVMVVGLGVFFVIEKLCYGGTRTRRMRKARRSMPTPITITGATGHRRPGAGG